NLPDAIEKLTQTTLRNVIGEMELDHVLSSRDTINAKLREILDEATHKWGAKVSRVELKDINPPRDIRDAMEKQMRAERDRRAAILTAEAEKQSRTLQSEGIRQSEINQAEGQKQARILAAEAEANARLKVAEAEAQAIERITTAIKGTGGDPARYLIAIRYIEALKEMVTSPQRGRLCGAREPARRTRWHPRPARHDRRRPGGRRSALRHRRRYGRRARRRRALLRDQVDRPPLRDARRATHPDRGTAGDRARSSERRQPHGEEPGALERRQDVVRELWVGDELVPGRGPHAPVARAGSLPRAGLSLRHLAVRRRKGEPDGSERHAVRDRYPQRRGAHRGTRRPGLGHAARSRPTRAELAEVLQRLAERREALRGAVTGERGGRLRLAVLLPRPRARPTGTRP